MNQRIRNGILAICFFAAVAVCWSNAPFRQAAAGAVRGGAAAFENAVSEALPYRQELIDLNGWAARRMDMRGYFSDSGVYVGDGCYIMSAGKETSTDYEFEQVMALKEYLDGRGMKLLYVNEPTKYFDDSVFEKSFGKRSFVNRNADRLLARIEEAGVPVLDLRQEAVDDGIDVHDMFYRTDHHWNTRAALWATGKIAGALNEYCGYDIDLSIYDPDRYTYRTWEKCWLGEQGRKLGVTYTGLDDFTEIKPDFPTDYTFKNSGDPFEGTFDDFIDESYYENTGQEYGVVSWHYSYKQRDVINHLSDQGNIFILTDSYDQTTVPFLSLSVHELDNLILRNYMGDIPSLIKNEDYDTVIICYASFMIGAHDDPDSANYRMFSFM